MVAATVFTRLHGLDVLGAEPERERRVLCRASCGVDIEVSLSPIYGTQ